MDTLDTQIFHHSHRAESALVKFLRFGAVFCHGHWVKGTIGNFSLETMDTMDTLDTLDTLDTQIFHHSHRA